jgi:hypothetical protein
VGHIFYSLKSGSLISIGQTCDDDCVALFTTYNVKIYKNGQVIMVGKRSITNCLCWDIPLAPKATPPPTIPNIKQDSAIGALQNTGTKQDLEGPSSMLIFPVCLSLRTDSRPTSYLILETRPPACHVHTTCAPRACRDVACTSHSWLLSHCIPTAFPLHLGCI